MKSGKPKQPVMLEDVILLDDLAAEKVKGGAGKLVFGEPVEQMEDREADNLPGQRRRGAPKNKERK